VTTRFSRWWATRRRSRALKKIRKWQREAHPLGELRQFVYLDDVALQSLFVARHGPEAVRITESNTRSREAEVNTTAGATVPGIATLGTEGRLQSSVSVGREVERLVSKQSMFRDFLDAEIRLIEGIGEQEAAGALWRVEAGRAVPSELRRGQLIEVRIRLQAHRYFRLASFLDSVAHLAADAPGVLDADSDFGTGARLFKELLIGQVPIDAEILDFGWDPEAARMAPRGIGIEPVSLGALTSTANFWADLRTTLFDEQECTALVRVTSTGLDQAWTPLKLFDAIRGIPGIPGVAFMDDFVNTLDGLLAGVPSAPAEGKGPVLEVLLQYASALTGSVPLPSLTTQLTEVARALDTSAASSLPAAFASVERLLGGAALSLNGDARADLQESLRTAAGLGLNGLIASPPVAPLTRNEERSGPGGRSTLAGEVIAIYW